MNLCKRIGPQAIPEEKRMGKTKSNVNTIVFRSVTPPESLQARKGGAATDSRGSADLETVLFTLDLALPLHFSSVIAWGPILW